MSHEYVQSQNVSWHTHTDAPNFHGSHNTFNKWQRPKHTCANSMTVSGICRHTADHPCDTRVVEWQWTVKWCDGHLGGTIPGGIIPMPGNKFWLPVPATAALGPRRICNRGSSSQQTAGISPFQFIITHINSSLQHWWLHQRLYHSHQQ